MRVKPYSLRNQVLFYLFLVASFAFLLTEIIIIEKSRRSLIRASDKTAEAYALGLASLIEVEPSGSVDLESTDKIMRDSTGSHPRAYFLILRVSDNSEIERSESLRNVNVPLPKPLHLFSQGKPEIWYADINGKKVRFVALREFAQSEDEAGPGNREEDIFPEENLGITPRKSSLSGPTNYEFLFVVGLDNTYINRRLKDTVRATVPALGVGLFLMFLFSWITISHSLKPLRRLDQEVQPIDASHMVPVTIPDVKEVASVACTLNRVISNLRDAFEREKRFTSNVAHELRTPISEIRSLSEVALKWPEGMDENNRKNYEDILASAKEMQETVANLLTLARCQSGNLKLREDRVELKPFIVSIWKECADMAADKRVTVHYEVPSGLFIVTDKDFLQVILHNLFSNAVSYTPIGGEIEWKLDTTENEFVFSISNSVEGLSNHDLSCLFEPFWRKDETRTPGSNHCGLGLSLVQSLSSVLGIIVSPHLATPTLLTITLTGKKQSAKSSPNNRES